MSVVMIDETYEFSAPRFFDFIKGESDEEMQKAELWFDKALSYAPSPFMPRIKTDRSFTVESLCNFSEAADQIQKASESSDSNATNCPSEMKQQPELISAETKEVEVTPTEAKEEHNGDLVNVVSVATDACEDLAGTVSTQENGRTASSTVNMEPAGDEEKSKSSVQVGAEFCTPKPLIPSQKGAIDSKKQQTAKKLASIIKNPSSLKPKNQLKSLQAKRDTNAKNVAGTPSLALENQAIKRQKLDSGRSRQVTFYCSYYRLSFILNVKPQNLPHKSKLGLTRSSSSFCTSIASKSNKEDRKVYVRERELPFVSMAEMMKKFNSSTRDLSLPHVHKKALTLTRPKEPELETSQRVRSVRVKSTAELEEEMMAKIPKFKARPLNKKIMEAPTLPAPPRSTPQPTEFQEFHLETMARANQNAETSSVASTEVSRRQKQWKPCLTEPRSPALHTLLRARPPTVKSSAELELEELEKAPKFKARPLNKKIFESKGELGIFCNAKKHVTRPQEFHFSINERIPPAAAVVDMFDKLSLNSEPRYDKPLPRNTKPNPFHLYTEERGAEKERKFVVEVVHKQLEEERARIRKANPYPYTTDYPVIPPKPEPKQCTKPEPFQLESLVRHEEEMQREMEERKRKEKEEAQMRMFKAQPVLQEDPIPVPEKVRKPLTEVQGFNLHLEHRVVERAEFDQKIKEKEMMYKRYREETEAARMMEEEKALKQLRRTLVPHARPVPNFDQPFCPQKSSKESTKPKSPKLRVIQRKERRKMLLATVISSATAHR
ncbi:hypothetical protein Pint_02297 [Pistacia integerrima]|uniref:Uncharacterized protein n=1 Tax=Pistacia integerrima TaxID=434235 RepID=A0ACC0ZJK6_9ROSI|nr:hypothetical protein Pint_02297 [Pistacia integerrima]